MRLWSIHPKYLDPQGLVALWREGLLARKVLMGKTKGYKNHPQLLRFKDQKDPVAAINSYLKSVLREAKTRGYSFSAEKLSDLRFSGKIKITSGQLLYELKHLKKKLFIRNRRFYILLRAVKNPQAHPVFRKVRGKVEGWERL